MAWVGIAALGVLISASSILAKDIGYFSTNYFEPSDYLYGSNGAHGDPVFDQYRTIDLDIDIGVNSDCGRISIRNTLRAALKNILDSKYLGAIGRDIMAASPMLMVCYFSPTWCAILKQAQLKAGLLAQFRLNQCGLIDKYTDQRVSDFYEDRSRCVQGAIRKYDGNFEEAMESCKNYADFDIKDWGGQKGNGMKKLIESTARWAKMTDEQSKRIVDLTKAFIGDTIVRQGEIHVDFGPRRVQLTPRTYLMEVKATTFKKLCSELLPKLVRAGGYRANVYKVISESDLKDVSGSNNIRLDHQTMLSLAYMPYQKRNLACRKLSDALAMGTYTNDMGKALDFISSTLQSNPHLPEKHKKEAELKRRAFKDHVEITLSLESQNSDPINQVLFQINQEGMKYLKTASDRELDNERESVHSKQVDNLFFDCADGVGCQYQHR
ncbi:MAG: hypothetical protein HYW48_11970 [Deltaproteobacteria bacterium]|nr:hypothetical protein [Deltaproteobacteria bacterium]